MTLRSRLLMVFIWNFCEKRQIWVAYLNPIFEEVRGDARSWLTALCKANGRVCIRINWTFLAICYGSGVMRRNVYSLAVSTGVDLPALKFYVDRVILINRSWHQKTRDTGLLDGEDRISLRSLILTQYRSVTDRRRDIYSAFKSSFAAL